MHNWSGIWNPHHIIGDFWRLHLIGRTTVTWEVMETQLAQSFVVSARCETVTPRRTGRRHPHSGHKYVVGFQNQALVQSVNAAPLGHCSGMPGAARSWPLRKRCQDFKGRDAKEAESGVIASHSFLFTPPLSRICWMVAHSPMPTFWKVVMRL